MIAKWMERWAACDAVAEQAALVDEITIAARLEGQRGNASAMQSLVALGTEMMRQVIGRNAVRDRSSTVMVLEESSTPQSTQPHLTVVSGPSEIRAQRSATCDASCTEVVASLAQRTHAGGPLPRPLNREGENRPARAHLVAEIRNAIAPLMLDDGEGLEAGERRLCLARVVRACDALMALERA